MKKNQIISATLKRKCFLLLLLLELISVVVTAQGFGTYFLPKLQQSGHVMALESHESNRQEGILYEGSYHTMAFANAIRGNWRPTSFAVKAINNPGSIYDPLKIEFELQESRFVDARVFDMRGKELFKKRLGYLHSGTHLFDLYIEGLQWVGNYVLVLFAEDRTATIIFVRM